MGGLGWLVLLVAIADWLALRFRVVSHSPWVLAILVALALSLLGLRWAGVIRNLARHPERRGSRAAELCLVSGVLLALLAGMTNWLLGLQGYVILIEGDSVPVHGASHLQGFEAGPVARMDEMGLVLALDEVELVPASDGGFYPRSRLRFWRDDGEAVPLELGARQSATSGSLRFFQGAFGFAPRIVIVRDEVTLFDRVVPFVTERRGPSGISFEGSFTLESEAIRVAGVIDLTGLDEALRGHATLHLEVSRGDQPLGRGSLRPGHFAAIEEGYRIGFAGLEKWSEVDIMRRNYGKAVVGGTVLAMAGALAWAVARWRRW
jgi:hypothetical protein